MGAERGALTVLGTNSEADVLGPVHNVSTLAYGLSAPYVTLPVASPPAEIKVALGRGLTQGVHLLKVMAHLSRCHERIRNWKKPFVLSVPLDILQS